MLGFVRFPLPAKSAAIRGVDLGTRPNPRLRAAIDQSSEGLFSGRATLASRLQPNPERSEPLALAVTCGLADEAWAGAGTERRAPLQGLCSEASTTLFAPNDEQGGHAARMQWSPAHLLRFRGDKSGPGRSWDTTQKPDPKRKAGAGPGDSRAEACPSDEVQCLPTKAGWNT